MIGFGLTVIAGLAHFGITAELIRSTLCKSSILAINEYKLSIKIYFVLYLIVYNLAIVASLTYFDYSFWRNTDMIEKRTYHAKFSICNHNYDVLLSLGINIQLYTLFVHLWMCIYYKSVRKLKKKIAQNICIALNMFMIGLSAMVVTNISLINADDPQRQVWVASVLSLTLRITIAVLAIGATYFVKYMQKAIWKIRVYVTDTHEEDETDESLALVPQCAIYRMKILAHVSYLWMLSNLANNFLLLQLPDIMLQWDLYILCFLRIFDIIFLYCVVQIYRPNWGWMWFTKNTPSKNVRPFTDEFSDSESLNDVVPDGSRNKTGSLTSLKSAKTDYNLDNINSPDLNRSQSMQGMIAAMRAKNAMIKSNNNNKVEIETESGLCKMQTDTNINDNNNEKPNAARRTSTVGARRASLIVKNAMKIKSMTNTVPATSNRRTSLVASMARRASNVRTNANVSNHIANAANRIIQRTKSKQWKNVIASAHVGDDLDFEYDEGDTFYGDSSNKTQSNVNKRNNNRQMSILGNFKGDDDFEVEEYERIPTRKFHGRRASLIHENTGHKFTDLKSGSNRTNHDHDII